LKAEERRKAIDIGQHITKAEPWWRTSTTNMIRSDLAEQTDQEREQDDEQQLGLKTASTRALYRSAPLADEKCRGQYVVTTVSINVGRRITRAEDWFRINTRGTSYTPVVKMTRSDLVYTSLLLALSLTSSLSHPGLTHSWPGCVPSEHLDRSILRRWAGLEQTLEPGRRLQRKRGHQLDC